MFNKYQRNQQRDWRSLRNELTELTNTYHSRRNEMDDFTAHAFQDELAARRKEYELQIVSGAKREMAGAIAEYKAADAKAEAAHQHEAARFDVVKLAAEMQAFDFLFRNQSVKAKSGDTQAIKTVEKIYHEAATSGDVTRQRAAAEALQNTDMIFKDAPKELRAQVGVMGMQAKRDLAAVRTTPEITEAYDQVKAAGQKCLDIKAEMLEACAPVYGSPADNLFGGSELEKAARLVNVVNGLFTVYSEQAPEITGIKWTPEAARVGGNG